MFIPSDQMVAAMIIATTLNEPDLHPSDLAQIILTLKNIPHFDVDQELRGNL